MMARSRYHLVAAGLWMSIWLFPFSFGPNHDALQILFAASAVLGLCALLPLSLPHPLILSTLGVLIFSIALRSAGINLNFIASLLAVVLMGLAAAIGARWGLLNAKDRKEIPEARATKSPTTYQWFAWAWLGAGLISAFIALCQALDIEASFAPWFVLTPAHHGFANLRQRNLYATFNTTALLSLLYLVHVQFHAGVNAGLAYSKRVQYLGIAVAAVLGMASALSYSRIGLLQLALVLGAALIWRKQCHRAIWYVLLACMLAYFATAFYLPYLHQAFVAPLSGVGGIVPGGAIARINLGPDHCETRGILWRNTWQLIQERPWQGWGWREFAWAHFNAELEPRFCRLVDHAHNLLLQLAAELGLPVAALVSGLLLGMLYIGWRHAKQSALHAWALGVVLAILLHSMVEFPLWHTPFQIAFGLCMGYLLSPVSVPQDTVAFPSASPSKPHWSTRLKAPLLGLSFLALGVSALDYVRVSQAYLPVSKRQAWLQQLPWSNECLFCNQRDFAVVTTTPVTKANAEWLHREALRLLHFSPEPRLLIVAVETAQILGKVEVEAQLRKKFQAAYPWPYERWLQTQQSGLSNSPPQISSPKPQLMAGWSESSIQACFESPEA
jgi:O-antigen ligase